MGRKVKSNFRLHKHLSEMVFTKWHDQEGSLPKQGLQRLKTGSAAPIQSVEKPYALFWLWIFVPLEPLNGISRQMHPTFSHASHTHWHWTSIIGRSVMLWERSHHHPSAAKTRGRWELVFASRIFTCEFFCDCFCLFPCHPRLLGRRVSDTKHRHLLLYMLRMNPWRSKKTQYSSRAFAR